MADFVSPFWHFFILVVTVASIFGLFIFATRLSTRHGPAPVAGETSGHVWDEDLEEYNNPLPRWWLNLLYLTLAWGLGYLLAYPGLGALGGLLGWSQTAQYEAEIAAAEARYAPIYARLSAMSVHELMRDPQAMKIGGRLFSHHCAGCHGSDGRGGWSFPNLRDTDWLYGGSPETLTATISHGRQGVMPAWGTILPPEGVNEVAAHVARLAGQDVDVGATTRGAEIFGTHCAACHGAAGTGNPLMGAPNLTDDIWLYGGTMSRIRESIVQGRQGRMPAHLPLIGEAKVHVLAAYVHSFSTAADAGAP